MRTLRILLSLLLLQESQGFGIVPGVSSSLTQLSSVTQLVPAAQNLLDSAVQGYQHALQADPLATQVETGVFLAVVGDAIGQKTQSSEPYNVNRAASFAAFDACYRAAQHYLYPPMIALCNGAVLGTLLPNNLQLAAAVEQALVSQVVIIPLVYYPCFYAITGAVQGLTVKETIDRAKDGAWSLMLRNWLFWIPVQFGVFGFVPDEDAQISLLIACGLVWTIILSAIAGAETPKERYNEPIENILTLPEEEMERSFGSTAYGERALETPEGRPTKSAVGSQSCIISCQSCIISEEWEFHNAPF